MEGPHPGDGHAIGPHLETVASFGEDTIDNDLDFGEVETILSKVRDDVAVVRVEEEGLLDLRLLGAATAEVATATAVPLADAADAAFFRVGMLAPSSSSTPTLSSLLTLSSLARGSSSSSPVASRWPVEVIGK